MVTRTIKLMPETMMKGKQVTRGGQPARRDMGNRTVRAVLNKAGEP